MRNSKPIVYLVDDDEEFLESVKSLLLSHGYQVEAHLSARSFLEQHNAAKPGCLVLDYAMDGMDGLALQTYLVLNKIRRPIVFLTGHAEIRQSVAAMKAGAVDFLVKPFDEEELIHAIRQCLQKDKLYREKEKTKSELRQALASLTRRERTIMNLIIQGLISKEIADHLGITERTVKFHRSHLMRKLRANSVVELMNIVHSHNSKKKDGTEH